MDTYSSSAVNKEDLAKRKTRANPVAAQQGRAYPSDITSQLIHDTGMIQPGAHPEYQEKPTPLEKIGAWIDKHFGTKHVPMPPPKQ